MRTLKTIAFGWACLAGVSDASATTYVGTFDFSASSFTASTGSVPYAAMSGEITLNFTTTATSVSNQATGITMRSFSASPSATPYVYAPTLEYNYNASTDTLTIGANSNVSTLTTTANDFRLTIANAFKSLIHSGSSFVYSSKAPSTKATYTAQALSVLSVPEPETWTTMVLGFGMLGGALRLDRRKRQNSCSSATASDRPKLRAFQCGRRPKAVLAISCSLMAAGCHKAKAIVAVSNDMSPISPDEAADEAMADHSVVNETARSGVSR